MPFTHKIVEEIRLLSQFDLSSTRDGIKVHSDAEQSLIEAAKSLHRKGLVTQHDGGYLTSRGLAAAEHTKGLIDLLHD